MKRIWLGLTVAILLTSATRGDDPKQAEETEKRALLSTAALDFQAKPDDAKAFSAFMNEYVLGIRNLARTNVADAEKKLAEMNKVLESLGEVEGAAAKRNVELAKRLAGQLKDTVELEKVSLPDLEKQLDANPHDVSALTKYYGKARSQLSSIARSDPEQAEKLLAASKQRIEKGLEGAADNDKKQLEGFVKSLASLERTIESSKKMLALIGKDASPLEVEAWVNGSPLTDADLKGKVVLLDFWAVWCGPCIQTFPHLREWHEKYADKGLVIIGVTNYYKRYDFDDTTGSLKQAAEPLTPEAEHDMLERFGAHHKLHHRFALEVKSKMSEFYGVTGIPHVAIIDQAGKIRMMKVGSGDQNAKDLGDLLETLLAKAPATGS
jgi:thiol-disulfide isomerase/thioredoxin